MSSLRCEHSETPVSDDEVVLKCLYTPGFVDANGVLTTENLKVEELLAKQRANDLCGNSNGTSVFRERRTGQLQAEKVLRELVAERPDRKPRTPVGYSAFVVSRLKELSDSALEVVDDGCADQPEHAVIRTVAPDFAPGALRVMRERLLLEMSQDIRQFAG